MIRTPILAALTLFAAAPILPQAATLSAAESPPRTYAAIERIDWSFGDDQAPGHIRQLRFSHNGMMTTFSPEEARGIMGELATASLTSPGEAVSFRLVREAGLLACSGRVERAGSAAGTCRFDPNLAFAGELARRGLAPQKNDEMLALALVNARLAVVDGLAGKGFHLRGSGDFIAVSALGVTPAFADELHNAGLKVDELGDLIALKALKVDSRWLAEMADAGYPDLAAGQAIQMRALGVTPDYAVRMARVLHAVGEIQ